MKNTSINRYNVAVVDQSGKVGTVRYYQKGGRTYVRSAANRVDSNSNPRSDAQMKTRLMYNSRVAIYRLFKGLLRNAFQFKPRYQSDYLAYMSANANIGCYMTRDEYRNGKIVLLPVKVAEGELKAIVLTVAASNVVTSLSAGAASAFTTIGGLSQVIVGNNPGFEYGDQITMISGKADGTVEVHSIVLNANDETSTQAWGVESGMIAYAKTGIDFCAAIHANSDGLTSNAIVALSSAATAEYNTYLSAEKFQIARDSYGKAKESILIPAKSVSIVASAPEDGGDNGNQDPTPSEPASVQTPTISGMTPFASTSEVTLSAENGAAIHYTTDGSIPTSESQTYSAPFMLSSTTVVKAIAIKDGVSSDIASKTFTKSSSNDD